MPGIKQVPTQLMPLHVWGSVLPHPVYSPDLAPSNFHLFPKLKKSSGAKTLVLIKKSRMQYATGFRRNRKAFLHMKFKNLFNVGKRVLKLEDIMWNSEYVQV